MLNETMSALHSHPDETTLGAVAAMSHVDNNIPSPSAEAAQPDTIMVESRYGMLTFTADQAVMMERTILGFPHLTEFGIARLPSESGASLVLLQSLEDANIAFPCVALDVTNPMIDQTDIETTCTQFGIKVEDCAVLCILTIRKGDDGHNQLTLNLRAPVFVDTARRLAWQHVLHNPRYPIRHTM